MSVAVTDLINRASLLIGDPSNRRTSRDEFLLHLDTIQNKLATETRCIEVDADLNVAAGVYEYPYPPSSVGITGIQFSEAPAQGGFYPLDEKFKDEWRRMTYRMRPAGNPWAYFARTRSFEVTGTPTVDVTDGFIVTYWIKAERTLTETGTVMQVPDFLEDHVIDGMVIRARMTGRDRVAAAQDYNVWLASLADLREKIEDRSDDRRAAIRAPGCDNPFGGMV